MSKPRESGLFSLYLLAASSAVCAIAATAATVAARTFNSTARPFTSAAAASRSALCIDAAPAAPGSGAATLRRACTAAAAAVAAGTSAATAASLAARVVARVGCNDRRGAQDHDHAKHHCEQFGIHPISLLAFSGPYPGTWNHV